MLTQIVHPAGIDLFCTGKKFLVYNMVSRNLKIKYRRSFFGVFWTLLSPIGTAMIFYFVFKVIWKVEVPNYLAFILSGVLPWAFFSSSLMENTESLVGNLGILSKVPVPIQVFPLVGTLTNLVTLFLALPILIGAAVVSGVQLNASLLMLLPLFGLLFLMCYGFSLVFAVAFVYFRDLRHLMGIVIQMWFYATPVIYGEAMIPEQYRWIISANPVAPIITEIHRILANGEWPRPDRLGLAAGWSLSVLAMAVLTRKYACRELVEQL